MNEEAERPIKPALNLSLILAGSILGLCLIVAALIVAKPAGLFGPSADAVAAQAIGQIKDQISRRSYAVPGQAAETVKDVILDDCRMSPNYNRVDIKYHVVWQPDLSTTYTGLTLTKDQYGRFDSGEVVMSNGDAEPPTFHVTVE